MKNILRLIAAALVFTACSSPKYAYHFDHYDYNSGRKANTTAQQTPVQEEVSPLLLAPENVVADAAPSPILDLNKKADIETAKQAVAKRVASMSKAEKKELKNEIKNYIKSAKQKETYSGNSVNATKAWDHDLKMAAIFGAIGIVLTALGGINTVFWVLGVIALVVGVVFLIKWLARQ